jgi:hypothetical protein
MAVAAVAGIAFALSACVATKAPPPPPPTTTTTRPRVVTTTTRPPVTTTTTAAAPLPDSGTSDLFTGRFFSATASWNQPVSAFGASTALASYADRFWVNSNFGGIANPALRGTVDVSFNDYSVPIYDAAAATTTVRLFQAGFAQALGIPFTNIAIGDSIPWNPSWRPGTGNDRIMAIIDHTTGRTWELWDAYDHPFNCLDWWGPNARAGYDLTNANDLCIGSAVTYTNLMTATDGTTTNDRGMGINKLALVTRADEVASGGINHALEMTVYNTMFGPLCSAGQLNTAAAGVDCAFSLPPATRVEYSTGPTLDCGVNTPEATPAARSRTVPEGIRFALNLTDTQISAWLDSRGYTGATRNTARIFAIGLRDYGWIIGESGCYGASIETDGLIDPVSRAKWSALGIQDSSTVGQLLHGLFTQSAIYVVNPSGPATAVPW